MTSLMDTSAIGWVPLPCQSVTRVPATSRPDVGAPARVRCHLWSGPCREELVLVALPSCCGLCLRLFVTAGANSPSSLGCVLSTPYSRAYRLPKGTGLNCCLAQVKYFRSDFFTMQYFVGISPYSCLMILAL